MSQRFERRRPKGAGSGDRPSGGPRGGKPSRFGAPRPEWRSGGGPDRDRRDSRDGGESRSLGDSRGSGDSREGREGRPAERRGGYRPDAPRRDGFQRPQGEGRPARVIGARPGARRFDDQPPGGGRRPEGRPDRRPEGRDQGRRPSFGPPRFSRPEGERPRFQPGRPPARSQRFAVDEAPAPEPTGSSERFGAEPADDLIWGRHPAQAALEGDRPIHRIWCTPELRFAPRFLQLLRDAKASGVLVEEVTWARLGQISGGAVHQGIVLQVAAAETLDLPSLIEGCRSIDEPPLLMAVDGLTDPHNLGAIVRSAEALGAHGLVLPQRRNAGLTGSVAKVAAGALEHLPVARVVNLNRAIEQLKDEGYRVVGLAEEGTVSLVEADLDGPLVVVTGSEAQGLSMLTRKHCDQLIRIPLRGATPSLNASVATALLLYEIARRGWMKSITGNARAPRLVRPQVPTTAALSTAAVSTAAVSTAAASSPAASSATAGSETAFPEPALTAPMAEATPAAPLAVPVAEPTAEPSPEPTPDPIVDPGASRQSEVSPEATPEATLQSQPDGPAATEPDASAPPEPPQAETHAQANEQAADPAAEPDTGTDTETVADTPVLELQVALPGEIELGFSPPATSPFQGDIRL